VAATFSYWWQSTHTLLTSGTCTSFFCTIAAEPEPEVTAMIPIAETANTHRLIMYPLLCAVWLGSIDFARMSKGYVPHFPFRGD
jgi:hypothetical protein